MTASCVAYVVARFPFHSRQPAKARPPRESRAREEGSGMGGRWSFSAGFKQTVKPEGPPISCTHFKGSCDHQFGEEDTGRWCSEHEWPAAVSAA